MALCSALLNLRKSGADTPWHDTTRVRVEPKRLTAYLVFPMRLSPLNTKNGKRVDWPRDTCSNTAWKSALLPMTIL